MKSRSAVYINAVVICTLTPVAGCMAATDPNDGDFYIGSVGPHTGAEADAQFGEARAAFVYSRDDYHYTATPAVGYWGEWNQDIYCNPGSWAVGYKLRVESSQGRGDDTALNSVQLLCQDKSGSNIEWISSYDGMWGDWGNPASCSGEANFLTSARMRVEDQQDRGDDTAANDVEFGCRHGGSIHTTNGEGWGGWYEWRYCPTDTAVCGISIRFEGSQGRGDDTAMNGMRLHCCWL